MDELDKIVATTQKSLGKHVKKPPLTSKLLKKPPFRFLHDVICVVVKEHGFLRGLFTDTELTFDNVKERDAKIAFLTKLIDATKFVTKKNLKARPSKIIAGLEPEETNYLLQAIGGALTSKIDTTDFVVDQQQQQKGNTVVKQTKTKSKIEKASTKSNEKLTKQSSTRKVGKETPKTDEIKRKKRETTSKTKDDVKKPSKTKERLSKTSDVTPKLEFDSQNNNATIQENVPKVQEMLEFQEPEVDLKISETDIMNESRGFKSKENVSEDEAHALQIKQIETNKDNVEINKDNVETHHEMNKERSEENKEKPEVPKEKPERPKSARPRSGDYKRPPSTIKKHDEPSLKANNEAIPLRPKSSLRPPSVRPSSARPGAPRLRPDSSIPVQEVVPMGKINVIIENYDDKVKNDDDDDEEETVVIQNTPEIENNDVGTILNLPTDKGHLVEQILEQINEDDVQEHTRPKIDINWEREGLKNVVKEINDLKTSIQSITRAANPLGKLLNYLQEDMETMENELGSWINVRKQTTNEIEKQKRANEDAIKPLEIQLTELKETIEKQRKEISVAKSNILRNDARILQLTERLLY